MDSWRGAVVLTHNRPTELLATVRALDVQCDHIFVIANASPDGAIPPEIFGLEYAALDLIAVPDQPPNLARLMNRGLLAASAIGCAEADEVHIAMVCDDAPPPLGWYTSVVDAMRESGARLGCTHAHQPITAPRFRDRPDRDIMNRITGHAWILREDDTRPPLLADENMHWWWQDTDLDWQARLSGGMVIAPGPVVPNIHPNDYTSSRPDCADRIHFDGLAFDAKWAEHGGRPW